MQPCLLMLLPPLSPHASPIFSFEYVLDPQDLHSFPTRRSSDLLVTLLNELHLELTSLELQEPNLERVFLHLTGRSEEHTSELQSRQYLVCRLLLEKKKSINEKGAPRALEDARWPETLLQPPLGA